MPWRDVPEPPIPPDQRMAAIFNRLGCLGISGLIIFALILGYIELF